MDSYEAEELGKYTSLSSLAVCALVLGIASLVALLAPLMVVIPIAGVVVSLFALVRIKNSAGALSGRALALTGLSLAVACGIASPLRVKVRDGLYSNQADLAGRQWLEIVARNELSAALDRTTGSAKANLMGPSSGDGPPTKYDPQTGAIKLENDTLVAKLLEESGHGELEFATQSLACDVSGAVPRVAAKYQTVKPDDSLSVTVVLLRSETAGKWLVDSWRLEGEGAHTHTHSHVH